MKLPGYYWLFFYLKLYNCTVLDCYFVPYFYMFELSLIVSWCILLVMKRKTRILLAARGLCLCRIKDNFSWAFYSMFNVVVSYCYVTVRYCSIHKIIHRDWRVFIFLKLSSWIILQLDFVAKATREHDSRRRVGSVLREVDNLLQYSVVSDCD